MPKDGVAAKNILELISAKPTSTYGILEQRMMDIVCAVIHDHPDWISRGLGDSVNSNNLSKAKLGDCDFQNSTSKSIKAYEAHGGRLTEIYFDGHLRTLKRSMEKRSMELEKIAEAKHWSIQIVFVAFDFSFKAPKPKKINGYSVSFEFVLFKDLLKMIAVQEKVFLPIYKTRFIETINARNIPQFARAKLLELTK
jgi:hypothetical protein